MRIKSIRVRNFKSFKDCTINFNDFNVVIGSNASGKSNLVQIFKFLKDIEEYGLENAISLQGGVEYFINNQIGASEDFSLEIEFSEDNLSLLPPDLDLDRLLKQEENELQKRVDIKELIYNFSIKFDSKNVDIYERGKDQLTHKIEILEKRGNEFEWLMNSKMLLYLSKENLTFTFEPPVEEIIKIQDFFSYLAFRNSFFSSPQLEKNFLLLQTPLFRLTYPPNNSGIFNKISIFDFDPKLPKKATPITGKIDLEEDGSNLAIVLNKILRDPEKQRKLSNLVTDLLPFIETLTVEKFADKSLMFKLKETYAKNNQYLPAAFISDGTINIVALIVALYFSNTSFTIIEEPERNLHPSLISKVVEMMKDASKQKQTLVTTHNPEMIKYADLEDILFISRDEDGFSQITRPADSERVKIFLENEIGMDELYVDNLLR